MIHDEFVCKPLTIMISKKLPRQFKNKLRAFLTALGIIFGVGAVIAMLAIGTGAKQSILDQMKLIGTNNIVIQAVIPKLDEQDNSETTAMADHCQRDVLCAERSGGGCDTCSLAIGAP